MDDFLFHFTGACGEHSHPNLLNVTLICALTYFAIKRIRSYES